MADNTPIAALPLTEVVDNYTALAVNNGQKNLPGLLIAAKWAWKNIFRNTKWTAIRTLVEINQNKPFTVWQIPKDTLRFLGVSYVDDCGQLKPIFQDPKMNVTELLKLKACGQDCLCDAIGSMTATAEDIIIDAAVYQKKVWTKKLSNGSVIEYTSQPVKDYDEEGNYTVIPNRETQRVICEVEVDEIGCIVPTEKNRSVLCECGFRCEDLCPKPCQEGYQNDKKYCGRWKQQDGKIYLQTGLKQVIFSRQTNGECEAEEMMIPEEAVDVMFAGIDHYTTAFNPRKNPYEKRESKRLFNAAKIDHIIFKDVFSLANFEETQNVMPKW